MKTQTYHPSPGEKIDHTIRHCLRVAKKQKCRVRFDFNETTLEATPKRSATSMLHEWETVRSRKHEAWRLSPAGQKYRREAQERSFDAITTMSNLLGTLPPLLASGDVDGLMRWLSAFAPASDHIDAKFDMAKLAKDLELAGYSAGEHVGENPDWFNTRDRMAHYIVGQVISCLNRGMPPHPITTKFVDEYFGMTA